MTKFAEDCSLELAGYTDEKEVPYFRKLTCLKVWETGDPIAADYEKRNPNSELAETTTPFALRSGLGYVEHIVSTGARMHLSTGNIKRLAFTLPSGTKTATWAEFTVVEPYIIKHAWELCRDYLHRVIGLVVIALHAGTEAAPLWEMLRADADSLAADAGVGEDLRSIARGASSTDPSEWEGALIRCRNVVDKVSRYLYQAPGRTYPHIADSSGTGPMAVDGPRYRNRLIAYMHQKGLNAEDREVADSHLGWFKAFVDQVNRLVSKGKQKVTRREVANGLIHTYLLLSEIATRTDGQPVTEIE